MEKSNKIQRSEVWEQIYKVVKTLPREEIECDAPDAPSVASELEELFLKLLPIHDVIGSLFSDEEIREAADEWVFDKNGMKWSNNDNTAGDNYGSFIAGVKWALSRLCNDR